ncbi:MAG: hypothetical protein ACFE8P_00300 [Promethearchaeota archaeon]
MVFTPNTSISVVLVCLFFRRVRKGRVDAVSKVTLLVHSRRRCVERLEAVSRDEISRLDEGSRYVLFLFQVISSHMKNDETFSS